jgi:hypothetical protein
VFHQYLFQQFECRLVKSTGSNDINIESSITSNYFNKLYRRIISAWWIRKIILLLPILESLSDVSFFKVRGVLIPIEGAIGLNEYGSPIAV